MRAGVHEVLEHDRQRGLEPDHPEGRGLELARLLEWRVRRVVGREHGQRVVDEPGHDRVAIGPRCAAAGSS